MNNPKETIRKLAEIASGLKEVSKLLGYQIRLNITDDGYMVSVDNFPPEHKFAYVDLFYGSSGSLVTLHVSEEGQTTAIEHWASIDEIPDDLFERLAI